MSLPKNSVKVAQPKIITFFRSELHSTMCPPFMFTGRTTIVIDSSSSLELKEDLFQPAHFKCALLYLCSLFW